MIPVSAPQGRVNNLLASNAQPRKVGGSPAVTAVLSSSSMSPLTLALAGQGALSW